MVLLINFPPPTEGVQLQQANTSVDIDGTNLGSGTLFIAENYVAWQKAEDGKGFSLQYPIISCHAISRDLTAHPRECLYLMVDGKLPGEESDSDEDDDEEEGGDDDSDAGLTEIRFVPEDKNMLEPLFAAMSDCQALHPDPEDVDSEEEGYGGFDYQEEQEEQEEEYTENAYGGFDYQEEQEEEYTENGVPNANGASATAATAPSSTVTETQEQLAHFAHVLQLGQGDGPGPSGALQPVMSPSGDAGAAEEDEEMDVGQFQDADAME
ncbi:hypothetical protein ACOMHN_008579 [Nucella lapillus]